MPFDLIVRENVVLVSLDRFSFVCCALCFGRDSGIERWTHKLCAFFSLFYSLFFSPLRRLVDSFQTNRISGGIAWMDTTIG